ncbi:MAG: V-type ATP synthase subunit D [Candidatus Omnitrophica bacterium]|nr:V-type ATP synthase subunit D [Candidatus Omnitrophota bacterium]MDD5488335.1 V-type ATP synthase subunit D [Candidatus Omnitrophota bacterium]
MGKIRLTKNELKKQKDALKRFRQYLPTLILKKQQLQTEILKIHNELEKVKQEKAYEKANIYKWVDVFAEKAGIEDLVSIEKIETQEGNIAGIDIPVFEKAVFKETGYDPMKVPLWIKDGIEAVKRVIELNAKTLILFRQDELVKEELRITTQRVNLFEKVMIPSAKDNIRKIQIYLGDMQTAAVVTGKIAKEKIQKKLQATGQ